MELWNFQECTTESKVHVTVMLRYMLDVANHHVHVSQSECVDSIPLSCTVFLELAIGELIERVLCMYVHDFLPEVKKL